MPLNAVVFDPLSNDQKTSAKHKWRGKLFSTEAKLKKNNESAEISDHNLSDFLHPSGSKVGPKAPSDLPAPRIDISAARRWPSAAEVIQITSSNQTERPRKPPRRAGLHVTFENAAPEVIGVGGDEAELPAIAVSRLQISNPPQPSSQPGTTATSSQPLPKDKRSSLLSNSSVSDNAEIFRPQVLQRRPTGLDHHFGQGNDQVENQDYRSNVAGPFARPRDFERLSPQQSTFDRNRSPVSLSDRYAEPETPTSGGFDIPTSHLRSHSPRPQGETKISEIAPSLQLPFFDQSFSFENSLTPIPTPTPEKPLLSRSISSKTKPTKPPPPHGYFESSHTDKLEVAPQRNSEEGQQSSKPLSEAPSLPDDNESLHADIVDPVPQDGAEADQQIPKPSSEVRAFSIRDVAKNLGDDALSDFASRVQRFNAIFQIGATVKSPIADIPFVQWIRTSAYWFLKGRGELERAVRIKTREPQETLAENDLNVSFGLRQAYLDLAKAWWILESITPNHPELRKFGHANLNSLKAIVRSFGDTNLAELIDVHLKITANMRALTMSMKRNSRLPSVSFEIQGLETRIFVEFPKFPPHVAVVLSERSQHFFVEDSPDIETFPIPVADTARHFIYSSVIVDLLYVSEVDEREETRLPCVLSVLRERSDWDLKAVIASQDGKVKLLIQSDKRAGLTWDGVNWEIKTNSIRLKLLDNIDIRVQFWERDFKNLWGIHAYTKKIREGLRSAEGEREVFKDELKTFQKTEQQSTKTFPPEPIKGCSIRLFEMQRLYSTGTGKRKLYGGHRLMIVTPPSLKILSSINLEFDRKLPILFNYFRDAETAPALLLKISKPSVDSFMVMTFHEAANRGKFHSLIDGTAISQMEICSESIPLSTFTMAETSVAGLPSFPGQNFVNSLRWEKLRVINKVSDSSPHINRTALPTDLRIWTECETGSLVDRMNFGGYLRPSFEHVFIAIRPWRDADESLRRSSPRDSTFTTPASGRDLFVCQK